MARRNFLVSYDVSDDKRRTKIFHLLLANGDHAQFSVFLCQLNATELARLFLLHVFSKHGVPQHITCDRGSEFTSHFFRALSDALGIKLHFTAGYHPSADGQTERVNQTLEQYLRMYCSYQQDNWSLLLPLGEFAYNNAPNATTGTSPFFANKGYNPSLDIHTDRDIANARAREYAVDLGELHQFLRDQMTAAQARYQGPADARRTAASSGVTGLGGYAEGLERRRSR